MRTDEPGREQPVEPPWHGPPLWLLPGTVAIDRMLLAGEHVAVAVREASCYPTGVRLGIEVAVRQGTWDQQQWEHAETAFWEKGHPGLDERTARDPGDRLVFTNETADGTRVSDRDGIRNRPRHEPEQPYLTEMGGSAFGSRGDFTRQIRLWLWPLPPPGDLDLVVAWPALHVPETRARLDADALLAAAGRSRPYWDGQSK